MDEMPNTYLKAFVALRERTAEGQRLPVDIVAWGDSGVEAEELLERALAMFAGQAAEKGSAIEAVEGG